MKSSQVMTSANCRGAPALLIFVIFTMYMLVCGLKQFSTKRLLTTPAAGNEHVDAGLATRMDAVPADDWRYRVHASDFASIAQAGAQVSDKLQHGYEVMYGMFLGPKRKTNFKFLEIGLGCTMKYGAGASLDLWRAFIPRADIWVAEYNVSCVEMCEREGTFERTGAHPLVGSQGNASDVGRWVFDSGGAFDVIVDDGGHFSSHILTSFSILWNSLLPGGLYFIEDISLTPRPYYDDTKGKRIMIDVVYSWIDQLVVPDKVLAPELRPVNPACPSCPPNRVRDRVPPRMKFAFCQKDACVFGKCDDGDTERQSRFCR
jgi:hypothetical protein